MIAQAVKRPFWGAAPSARRTLRMLRWRLRNRRRVIAHLMSRHPTADSGVVAELRREGVVVRGYGESAAADQGLYEEARQAAESLRDTWLATQYGESNQGGHKRYRAQLLHNPIDRQSPFIRLATDARILDAVNSYLGMFSCLRAIELWWDSPTPGPAEETQLWHRDADDLMNVKVFVYFNDVDVTTGPFSFVPRTHPIGERRELQVAVDSQGRASDQAMEQAVASSEWRVCVGPAATVTLCDTCGFHRGLKPTEKSRLMLMLHYTSGTPMYGRGFELQGPPARELPVAHRFALE